MFYRNWTEIDELPPVTGNGIEFLYINCLSLGVKFDNKEMLNLAP